MNDCEHCKRAGGLYNFDRICCRVRFILGLPTRELRSGWIERWREKSNEMADKVEAEVRRLWPDHMARKKLLETFPQLKAYEVEDGD